MDPPTTGHWHRVVPNGVLGKDEDGVPREDLEKVKVRQLFLQSIINNRCNVCKIVCNSFTNTMEHVRGKKHQEALLTCEDSSVYTLVHLECVTPAGPGVNGATPSGFTLEPNSWFRCNICDVVCSSLMVAGSHAAGKKHRQQELILGLRKKKDSMVASPKDIELSCLNGSPKDPANDATYNYEVLRGGKTMLNVTVTNRSEKDVLSLQYGLLRHITAVVNLQRTSKISNIMPGDTANVNISIQGDHLGMYSSALVFNFTWMSQPGNCLVVVRQLLVCCTDDTVKQLQPTTKYKRPVRSRFDHPAEVVDGFPLPKVSSGQLEREVPLDWFAVPRNLSHLHSKGMEAWDGMDPKLQLQLNEYRDLLKGGLSASNHHERFSLLLHCEEVQMHVDIRNYDMRGVMLTRCRENPRLLTLRVPGLAENRPSVLRGDCLFVRCCDAAGNATGNKEFKGYVHNTRLDEVWLGFHQSFLDSFVANSKFNVRFSVNRLPTQMNHRSVKLALDYTNDMLFPTIETAATWEGTSQVSSELTLQNASKHFKDRQLLSNAEQVAAVCSIVGGLSRPAPYLVFGPPGTGKTVTIVESIKQILRVLPSAHIMACAPSNSAADLLAERLLLHVPVTQMFRLNAASRSLVTIPTCIKPCSNVDRLSGAMYYPSKKELMQYQIIITTLVTAGRIVSARFPSSHFTHVFIDEAGHAVEPEALIAIAGILECRRYNGAQVVLAGDPKQLGPVIRSPTAKKYGLEMSLIERYMSTCDVYKRRDDGTYDTRLLTKLVCNYRSHPAILELPNSCFYDGELKPFADTLLRESLCSWEWLSKKGFPLIFHGVVGQDMREETSPSFFNPTEVSIVMDYVTKLLDTKRNKVKETDIGIISPYRKQVQKIQKMLRARHHGDVKAGSVEEFQGQERRVIIISTVRSNPEFLTLDKEYNLGFLDNPKRFNVAITRAKALLIIVGNPKILSKDKYWQQLLQHCCSHGAYTGVELVDDDTATDDMLQRFTDMQLDDIDKDAAESIEGQGDVSVMTRHEDPEWRHEI